MTQDPVIIVTGGGVGIGGAIVDRLLEKKAKVVVIDLVEGPVKQRQDSVGADKLQYVIGDVSKDEVNQKAVDAAINSWGKIDGVALNAGVMAPIERICDMKSAEVTKIFNINVVAHVSMLSAAIPHLRKSNGRVIFTSSDAGEQLQWKAWGAYGASKAAVNFFAQALTLEEPDITAISLYPGIVNTPLVSGLMRGKFAGMIPGELEEYSAYAKPLMVEPHQPGTAIANLVLGASKDLRGVTAFWNDDRFSRF